MLKLFDDVVWDRALDACGAASSSSFTSVSSLSLSYSPYPSLLILPVINKRQLLWFAQVVLKV